MRGKNWEDKRFEQHTLEEDEARLEDEHYQDSKLCEANNNSVSGGRCSPAHSKTPPLADSSTERDLLNDSEGQAGRQEGRKAGSPGSPGSPVGQKDRQLL